MMRNRAKQKNAQSDGIPRRIHFHSITRRSWGALRITPGLYRSWWLIDKWAAGAEFSQPEKKKKKGN